MTQTIIATVDTGATSHKVGIAVEGELDSMFETPPELEMYPNPKGGTPDDLMRTVVDSLGKSLLKRNLSFPSLQYLVLGVPTKVGQGGCLVDGLPNNPNPAWKGSEPAKILSRNLGIPVEIANDGNLAALGCARDYALSNGKPMKSTSVHALGVGSGLGGGLVRNGELIIGSHGGACESGHLPLGIQEVYRDFVASRWCPKEFKDSITDTLQKILFESDGRELLCGCGRRGHIETYACKMGLGSAYTLAIKNGLAAYLGERKLGVGDEGRLMAAACKGDEFATLLMNFAAWALGAGCAIVAGQDDPDAIIVYGAAFEENHLIADTSELERMKYFSRQEKIMKDAYKRSMAFPSTASSVGLHISPLGDVAPALGGLVYAKQLNQGQILC